MGGPLALATIAYGITGIMLYLYHRRRTNMLKGSKKGRAAADTDFGDMKKLARDQTWFLTIFIIKVTLGLVVFSLKPWLGVLFFIAYGIYFWREIRSGVGEEHGELDPLFLQSKKAVPDTWAILVQVSVTLVVIFLASQLFVQQLDAIGPMLGLSAAVTALLFSPVATELPEVMNAIIWVRQGKTPLALANISGSMMIQATVPSGLGIIFTSWHFSSAILMSGLVTMTAIIFLLTLMHYKKLSPITLGAASLFYALFAILLPFFPHK
jgi:cation:H+ antiporter